MKFQKIGRLTASFGLALLALGAMQTAHATDWNFGGLTSGSTYSSCGAGSCGTTSVSLTGLSTAISGMAVGDAGSASFTAANVYSWGGHGLGVVKESSTTNNGSYNIENRGSIGPHAVDNLYGTDAVVVGFTEAVNLSSLRVGWNGTDNGGNGYTDSDLSVFAWMGTGTPTTTTGLTQASLANAGSVTNGWKLIGNYADVGSETSPDNTAALASTVYSSNWLISAYNTNYGITSSNGGSLGGFNDEFKLLALSGAGCTTVLTGNSCGPGQVPEPSGLALLGLGLVGLLTAQNSRRRNNVAQMA